MFKIEKNVELKPGYSSRRVYPFPDMEVGDSFLALPDKNGTNRVRSAVHTWGKRHGKKFTCREETGGIRVWRTA